MCKFLGWKVYIATKMPQKKSASADLSVILIYSLFLFVHQKEQATHSSYAHSISLSPSWLVPFLVSKGTSLTKACIFFYTPTITIKAQPLWIVPSICATVSHFQIVRNSSKSIFRPFHLHGVDIHIRCLLGFHDHILFYTP